METVGRQIWNQNTNFLMDGALQRWERVHFQCYSDLAGQGLVGVESSQGRLVVILKVIVRVHLILEIL